MATYLNSGIYKIVNLCTGKLYVGCASNLRTRWNGHLHDLRRKKHPNNYLQKAWEKYREENFQFVIIETCPIYLLHEREHYWVNELNVLDKNIGYNLKPTDPKGCSLHSEETKEKLRKANKGKKPSENCINANKQKKLSKEHKELLAQSRLHIDFKKLHREKRGKKVKNMITDCIYNSLSEASEILDIPKYALSRQLSGKRKNNTNLIYVE